jgi:hypothetical protein
MVIKPLQESASWDEISHLWFETIEIISNNFGKKFNSHMAPHKGVDGKIFEETLFLLTM